MKVLIALVLGINVIWADITCRDGPEDGGVFLECDEGVKYCSKKTYANSAVEYGCGQCPKEMPDPEDYCTECYGVGINACNWNRGSLGIDQCFESDTKGIGRLIEQEPIPDKQYCADRCLSMESCKGITITSQPSDTGQPSEEEPVCNILGEHTTESKESWEYASRRCLDTNRVIVCNEGTQRIGESPSPRKCNPGTDVCYTQELFDFSSVYGCGECPEEGDCGQCYGKVYEPCNFELEDADGSSDGAVVILNILLLPLLLALWVF